MYQDVLYQVFMVERARLILIPYNEFIICIRCSTFLEKEPVRDFLWWDYFTINNIFIIFLYNTVNLRLITI